MDIKSPEERSKNMAAIHSKNTKPEIYLRKLLFAKGYRYGVNSKSVPGHPDIYMKKYNSQNNNNTEFDEELSPSIEFLSLNEKK